LKTLIISDIHGNYVALKAVLKEASGYDDVIVLGDLVDYGPDPDLVIDEVRSMNPTIVRGNHDEAVAEGVDCRAGPSMHDSSIYTRKYITLMKLGERDVRWLRSLRYSVTKYLGSNRLFIAHASVKDYLYKYLYPWMNEDDARNYLWVEGFNYVIIGHTHYQFLRPTTFGIKVLNPGSVGQPRDGDWRAAYALISDSGEVTFRRVKYEVNETLSRLKGLIGGSQHYVKLSKILMTGK